MAKSQEVAVKASTDLVVADDIFEAEAGAGSEAVRPEDQAVPFLRILQALSPQVKRANAAYVEGAKEGDVLNTVDQTIWDGERGILVIPCYFRPVLVEWRPREQGGGFVRSVEANGIEGIRLKASATRSDDGKVYLPNGNTLIDTAQHYVIQVTETGLGESSFVARALIAMSSTQLKVSRQWITLREQQIGKNAQGGRFALPSYACVYRLTTRSQSNEKGEFYNWSVSLYRRSTLDEVNMARAFYAGLRSGEVKHAEHDDEGSGAVHIHNADIL